MVFRGSKERVVSENCKKQASQKCHTLVFLPLPMVSVGSCGLGLEFYGFDWEIWFLQDLVVVLQRVEVIEDCRISSSDSVAHW